MAFTNFFGGAFFGGGFFGEGTSDDVVKTGTGGIDPPRARRVPFKPTGLLHLPKKHGRKEVEERVDESRQIQADIAVRLAKEFGEETLALLEKPPPIALMTMAQVELEISARIREKLRLEEDELMLMVLMACAAVV